MQTKKPGPYQGEHANRSYGIYKRCSSKGINSAELVEKYCVEYLESKKGVKLGVKGSRLYNKQFPGVLKYITNNFTNFAQYILTRASKGEKTIS